MVQSEAPLIRTLEKDSSHSARLCENYVHHGSTALTTNGIASLESKYLSARPELSHSTSFHTVCPLGMTSNPGAVISNELRDLSETTTGFYLRLGSHLTDREYLILSKFPPLTKPVIQNILTILDVSSDFRRF